MATLTIPASNGTYVVKTTTLYERLHDIAVDTTGVTSGQLIIKGKKPGSSVFETIPDGTINLAAPTTVLFEGTVAAFEFTLSSYVGTATVLNITDTATGGR